MFEKMGGSNIFATDYNIKTTAHDRQNEEVAMGITNFKIHVKHL